jgi:RNA polymerase sigma-70 factor, ECF subfamily
LSLREACASRRLFCFWQDLFGACPSFLGMRGGITSNKRKLSDMAGETFWLLLSLLGGDTSFSERNWEEDAQWVRSAKGGDRDAFERLYRKYVDRIYKFSYRLLSKTRDPKENAEDATSGAFLRCLAHVRSLQEDHLFFGFVRKTAFNLCMDVLRRRSLIAEDDPGEDEMLAAIPDPKDPVNPERKVLVEEVRTAMDSLKQEYRLAVILVHYEGYSYLEAARLMNCKENDIRRWVHRGAKQLRESFEGS